MTSVASTDRSLSEQLESTPERLRASLLEDPIQTRVWGVSPDNLDAVFAERSEQFRRIQPLLEQLCRDEHIPGSLGPELWHIYLPLARWILERSAPLRERRAGAYCLGINGAQGSGKTTINQILQLILRDGYGKRVVGLSIDDLYDTHEQRRHKGRTISPILARVRGPGTHDLDLAITILDRLIDGSETRIPRFDKSLAGNQGDRVPETEWQRVDEPQDIVILEGWNVGEAPFPADGHAERFEKLIETEGFHAWRDHYIQALADTERGYAALFRRLDDLVMIRIQAFAEVYANREQAEAKLRRRIDRHRGEGRPTDGISAMTEEEVRAFVDHYEPWTLHMLEEMPERAALVLWMGARHQITQITANP